MSAGEEGEVDGFGHGSVAGGVGVQVVAAIFGWKHAVGVGGIADGLVEVDEAVEVAGGANPGIDGLAVGLGGRAGMVVVGSAVGGDGGADDADAVGVGADDDLLIRGEDASDERGVFFG